MKHWNSIIINIATLVFILLSIVLSQYNFIGTGTVLISISSILCIKIAKKVSGNYFSLLTIFCLFVGMYGSFGLISAMSSEGLAAIYPYPYLTDIYLLHHSLAVLGLYISIYLNSIIKTKEINGNYLIRKFNFMAMERTSLVISILALLFFITNIYRVGGASVLFRGKALYQGAISDITLTLPDTSLAYLAIGLLGLSNQSIEKSKTVIISIYLILSPILISWIILGMRMEIITSVIIYLIASTYFNPVKRINTKTLLVVITSYVAISTIYITRPVIEKSYMSNDISYVTDILLDSDEMLKVLNPASNEFQAPFGNFNTHMLFRGIEEDRLGMTYLEGLTISIPRFLWPDKPISVVYEFRDKYFSGEGSRGSTAGTGFSSILEAFINFGTFGVFLIYFIISSLISLIERKKLAAKISFFPVLYFSFAPFCIVFSRSSLSNPFVGPLLLVVFSYIVYNIVSVSYSKLFYQK